MRYSIFPSFNSGQTEMLLEFLETIDENLNGDALPFPMAVCGDRLTVLLGGIWYKRIERGYNEVVLAMENTNVPPHEKAAYILLIAAQTKAYGDPGVVSNAGSVLAKVTEHCYYNLSLRHLPYYYGYYTEITGGASRPVYAVGFDKDGKVYFKEPEAWVSADGEVIQREPELVFMLRG